MTSTLNDAKEKLPELLTAARHGETVDIVNDGWIYRLLAIPPRARPEPTGIPKAGRWKGKTVVPDGFDEPLDELREYME